MFTLFVWSLISYQANDESGLVKIALLNQFTPLVALVTENFGEMGYQSICSCVFPLINQLLYDEGKDVRDKAIEVVAEIRTVVKDDWKEHVMSYSLGMAHDENDQLRESAVELLNEISPDMGQLINESFIVNEFRALSMDEHPNVRCAIVKNLNNVSKQVSVDIFENLVFPLYDRLTQDKEQKVRKTCAEFVASIAEVSPLERLSPQLQKLYFRFLMDPKSRIVRGTAFQNIGPFIATLKGIDHIDA